MARNPEESTPDLDADLAALRHDVAQLAASVSALVSHQTQAAGDRLAGSADRVADQVKQAGGQIEACVTRNPLTAALVAFGVGLTLGVFSRGRG